MGLNPFSKRKNPDLGMQHSTAASVTHNNGDYTYKQDTHDGTVTTTVSGPTAIQYNPDGTTKSLTDSVAKDENPAVYTSPAPAIVDNHHQDAPPPVIANVADTTTVTAVPPLTHNSTTEPAVHKVEVEFKTAANGDTLERNKDGGNWYVAQHNAPAPELVSEHGVGQLHGKEQTSYSFTVDDKGKSVETGYNHSLSGTNPTGTGAMPSTSPTDSKNDLHVFHPPSSDTATAKSDDMFALTPTHAAQPPASITPTSAQPTVTPAAPSTPTLAETAFPSANNGLSTVSSAPAMPTHTETAFHAPSAATAAAKSNDMFSAPATHAAPPTSSVTPVTAQSATTPAASQAPTVAETIFPSASNGLSSASNGPAFIDANAGKRPEVSASSSLTNFTPDSALGKHHMNNDVGL